MYTFKSTVIINCKLIVLALLMIGILSEVFGSDLRGSVSSSLYFWKSDSLDHVRPSAILDFTWRSRRDSNRPIFSVSSYSRWAGDLKDDSQLRSPKFNIYHAYLQIENLPASIRVQAGRMFAYSIAGSNVIDGVRVQFGRFSSLQASTYAGSWVSNSDSRRIRSLADFGVLGAELAYPVIRSTRVGVAWMRRLTEGQSDIHRVGLFLEARRSSAILYSRVVYNVDELRLAEILMRLTFGLKPWHGSAEFSFREPSLSSASLFSLIDSRNYSQGRFQLRRNLWKDIAVTGNLSVTAFDGKDAWSTTLALSSDFGSLGWQHQDGYSGDQDGLLGSLIVRPYQGIECFAGFNLSQYRVQSLQSVRNDSYSSSFGVRARLAARSEIASEVQYLRNAVQSEDIRFLVKFTQRFDTVTSLKLAGK